MYLSKSPFSRNLRRTDGPEDGDIASQDKQIADFLESAGIDRQVSQVAFEIDAVLQQWRRRVNKRELATAALRAFGLDDELDQAQFDVLVAIAAPALEFGEERESETMVSTVAARLRIDPSRASRLVSDLIGKGLARRAVSQQDARRTIVELTARGTAIVDAVRRFKFLVMGEFLSGWTEVERQTFVPLMARFVAWADEAQSVGPERFPDEIAAIAERLARKCAS
ncbi:MarR family winged helix-turn-helix transcriptional regulator [Pseudoruegeria sp. HB172150]|uniref:MarR family winged helix-turn-helix transcriptional regulator n=1 Tax=Pseudoruegeria sp. HB172150 TaxID=2721164 RepID=UPI001552B58E|nr:MarR family winged helix-turn-helix transcriptional regulator [Pseudoruegeria sp. HB172150]